MLLSSTQHTTLLCITPTTDSSNTNYQSVCLSLCPSICVQHDGSLCDTTVPPKGGDTGRDCFHTEFSSDAFRAITASCFISLATVQAAYGFKVPLCCLPRTVSPLLCPWCCATDALYLLLCAADSLHRYAQHHASTDCTPRFSCISANVIQLCSAFRCTLA